MNIKVLNFEGNKSETLKVSDSLMSLKPNNRLLKYVIDWQLNHAKKRLAKTNQRNEVVGSTRKIYAQKGTGGARHSSRKAPIFVGGGIAHGPKGDNYKVKKINKKIRKIALAQSISKKNINKELSVLLEQTKFQTSNKDQDSTIVKMHYSDLLIIPTENMIKVAVEGKVYQMEVSKKFMLQKAEEFLIRGNRSDD